MLGRVALLTLSLALAYHAVAEGRPGDGELPVRTLAVDADVLSLVRDWLVSERGLPDFAELPRVVLVPAEQLWTKRFGTAPPSTAMAGDTESPPETMALYSDAERTIYLMDGWSGATPVELSILVHEMVHHIQNLAGLRYACAEAREAPAFAAQEAWLGRFGSDLDAAFGIDALTLFARTRCLY